MHCICCKTKLEPSLSNYTFYCKACNYWASNLVPDIASEKLQLGNNIGRETDIDISHLDYIRRPNFEKILRYIGRLNKKENPKILDIGCGSGLFMQVSKELGLDIIGIEPNTLMFDAALKKGLDVRKGYFPEQLKQDEKFDVIILNDVFEHLENNDDLLKAVRIHLNPEGRLIINVPNADGVIFKIAKILRRFGVEKIWDRLWQKMFYTPHLHYFSPKSLSIILKNHNFALIQCDIRLQTLSVKGLWKRLSVDTSSSVSQKIIILIATLFIYPLLALGQPDSIIKVSKIKEKSSI